METPFDWSKLPPGSHPLDGVPPTPILGKLIFENIEWEIGQIGVADEDGKIEIMGVIFRFSYPALPWFKFQIPFARLEARNFIRAITEKLGDVSEDEPTETKT